MITKTMNEFCFDQYKIVLNIANGFKYLGTTRVKH